MMRLSIGYPSAEGEMDILRRKHGEQTRAKTVQVCTASEILLMKQQTANVFVANEIYAYIIALIHATRSHNAVRQGASPRASVTLMALAQAAAFLMGRNYVLPSDVQAVFKDAVAHRLILHTNTHDKAAVTAVLRDIAQNTPAPNVENRL
jgi:MoxR-like ATPase